MVKFILMLAVLGIILFAAKTMVFDEISNLDPSTKAAACEKEDEGIEGTAKKWADKAIWFLGDEPKEPEYPTAKEVKKDATNVAKNKCTPKQKPKAVN